MEVENITHSFHTTMLPEHSSLIHFRDSYARVHGVLATVVCVFGIIANLANVIVLTRKNMLSSTNCILTWLAVADLLTMVSCFLFVIHFYLMKNEELEPLETYSYPWVWLLIIHASFAIVCHTIATWLTIVLAIFRYIYIWLPTRGSFLCSMTRAKLSILFVYIFSVIIVIPNYMANVIINKHENQVRLIQRIYNHTNGSTYTTREIVPKRPVYTVYNDIKNEYVLNTLNFWVQAVMMKFIPCIMLTILTILLVIAMHVAYKRRMRLRNQTAKRRDDSSNSDHNRTTGMLLAIVVLFLITELPQGILTILSIFIKNFYVEVYMPMGDILDILALINNSINFVLYCSMSKQFRDTFSKIFCTCFMNRQFNWSHVTLITTTNGHEAKGNANSNSTPI